jgi:hypothetical protein
MFDRFGATSSHNKWMATLFIHHQFLPRDDCVQKRTVFNNLPLSPWWDAELLEETMNVIFGPKNPRCSSDTLSYLILVN